MVNDVIADPLAVANELRPVLLRLSRRAAQGDRAARRHEPAGDAPLADPRQPGPEPARAGGRGAISAPALSGHVDRLEKAGLIERVRDEDDRRRVGLALTEEGERLLKRVRARRTTWLADRLRGLDDDELDAIERAIEPLGRLL